MNPYVLEYARYLFWPSLRTPRGLLARAIYLWLLFGMLHLLGLREYTTFLSGMTLGHEPWSFTVLVGCLYILSYLAAVIAAPILTLAAIFLKVWRHFRPLSYD